MNYTIGSNELTVTVSSYGAEMQSIMYDGREYLWEADPKYWDEHSPVLFPYVGRFTNGQYTYKGKAYPMQLHGFARSSEFSLEEASDDSVTFRLTDSPETYEIYPFHFIFDVSYTIVENQILISYHVQNLTEGTMYFGIGGHPGFRMPLDEGLAFDDYYLEFPQEHIPSKVEQTPACFISGHEEFFHLEGGKRLHLHHDMFDNDAVILKNVADYVTLKSDKGKHSVSVYYPKMRYLGMWHAVKTEAPYVCLEPWVSLPSRQDIVEEFQFKHDLIRLDQDEDYQNDWKIIIR